MENPPGNLVSAREADSGPILFALVFGWILIFVYASFLYVLGRLIANAIRAGLQAVERPARARPYQTHPLRQPRDAPPAFWLVGPMAGPIL
jgi:hypothetical protein